MSQRVVLKLEGHREQRGATRRNARLYETTRDKFEIPDRPIMQNFQMNDSNMTETSF